MNQSHARRKHEQDGIVEKNQGSEEKRPSFLFNKNSPVNTNYFACVSILPGSGFIKQSNFTF